MYRKATKQDLPQIVSLWVQAFCGDTPTWVQNNLQAFVGLQNIYVAHDNTAVTAMLSAVPCTANGRQGAYFYALATSPAHRGRGIMGGLMQYAEAQLTQTGTAFICLIPASAQLFGYYSRRGYTLESRLRTLQKEISPNILATANFDTITATGFAAKRQAYFGSDAVAFLPHANAAIMADLYTSGISTAETSHAYAMYFERGGVLHIKELMAQATPYADILLQAIREKTGCEKAIVTLSPFASLYNGEGKLAPLALFKQLDATHPQQAPYIRFAFEDLEKEA